MLKPRSSLVVQGSTSNGDVRRRPEDVQHAGVRTCVRRAVVMHEVRGFVPSLVACVSEKGHGLSERLAALL